MFCPGNCRFSLCPGKCAIPETVILVNYLEYADSKFAVLVNVLEEYVSWNLSICECLGNCQICFFFFKNE